MACAPRIRPALLAAWTLAFAAVVAAQTSEPESPPAEPPVAVTNAFCPVMPEEPIDPNFFVDFQGQRVYLCCKRCKSKFEADPGAYIANLASFQPEPATEPATTPPEAESPPVAEQTPPDEAEGEHEHNAPATGDAGQVDWLKYTGRFHPVAVHLPIALLLVAAFFELIALAAPKSNARIVVRALLATGALSALVAAPLGLANAIGETYTGQLSWIFWWHRALGIAVAIIAIAAWIAFEIRRRAAEPKRAGLATLLILLTALLVALTSHFGGSLVYGWKHLWPPI